jgi:hypothetical protein
MWFINKETGLSWYIVDPEMIRRLEQDERYEIVNELVIDTAEESTVEATSKSIESKSSKSIKKGSEI